MVSKAIRGELLICGGTGCVASGSEKVKDALEKEMRKAGIRDEFNLIFTGCMGFCAQGPLILVKPDEILYQQVTPGDIPDLVTEHFLKGRPLKRLLYKAPESSELIPYMDNIPFFSKQLLWALRNRGILDPEKIDEYIARDGYLGAHKALTAMTPEEIIEEVKKSGLRGRGGAGFPTGLKWEFARRSPGEVKYVLCNADEGDPGAFMDRSLLEADPHAVLEGMIIAGKAIGAHQGYIYCRAEYPLALRRLDIAINQARDYGLLGKDILGSGFDFDIEVYQGAGAFVCGEETALMQSIEGKRGMPRPRPPFPAQKGLWGKPSILNNVETFANIPQIILNGGEWYASVGTETSKGTKVFALCGAVRNIGLVEVPMGTTLREIIYDIGGGIRDNRKFKAVQLGGPSGGCVPEQFLDTPTDYEAITKVGAIMGSGGMIVMDDRTCMVDIARFFLDFCQEESCGKCTPCREGTKRMLKILENIIRGKGKLSDLQELEELSYFIKDSSLCGLGQTAPNPVLSTLNYFRHEYEEHVVKKFCRSGVCSNRFGAKCIASCPIQQDVPGYLTLIADGRYEDAITLIYQTNPLPGVCGRVCHHPCTEVCVRKDYDETIAIEKLKRFAADMARLRALKPVLNKQRQNREKVAIIGGGPAGLSCAYFLALMGFRPHIFEEMPLLGGMLRYGISRFRLPREILEDEIKFILELGVEVTTRCKVGRDITFDQILEDFPAVFIATGAQRSQRLKVPGEELEGVYGAVEFMKAMELGTPPSLGKKIGIVGGGRIALELARALRRLGAKVTILYQREKPEMEVASDVLKEAEEEGVEILSLLMPKAINKNGTGLKIELSPCEMKVVTKGGKKRPVPLEGKSVTLEFDNIFSAVDQIPELGFAPQVKSTPVGIKVDKDTLVTNLPNVFAGGDVVAGSTVVEAIAQGKKAALQIARYLSEQAGKEVPTIEEVKVDFRMELPASVEKQAMAKSPRLSLEERLGSFKEVEQGLDEETARKEAQRCLRCDIRLGF